MRYLLANHDAWLDAFRRGSARHAGMVLDDGGLETATDMDSDTSNLLVGSDAIIQVTGPLSYKYDFWSWYSDGTSYQGISAKLDAAMGSADCKRVVMVFDTPGGEVTGIMELARKLRECIKETVAVVDPCAASAGLWLATQCKKIVSIESGEVGSLGVQCVAVSYAKMFEEAGIDVRVVRAGVSPDKNMAHPYEPMSKEAVEYLQGRVDKMAARFVADVAAGRGKDEKFVTENFGKGRMLDSQEAMDVGLIDSVGTLAGVLAEGSSVTRKRRYGATML